MDIENHQVIGAADEYEKLIGQESWHKRRIRLRFSMDESGVAMPIEFFEPKPTARAAILNELDLIQDSLNNLQTIIRDNSHLLGGES